MKKLGLIFAFLALAVILAISGTAIAASEFAELPQISNHEIHIQLQNDGSTDVLEKYFLKFSSKDDQNVFIAQAEKNGPTLQSWTIYDNRIFPHLGKQEDITSTKIYFDNKENALRLEYHLAKGIMDKQDETSRQTDWTLSRTAFSNYIKSGIIILPANTKIIITLPSNAVLLGPIVPETGLSSNTLTWKGYLTTNYMNLSYSIGKPIAQPIDTAKIVQDFFSNRQNLLILIIIALLIILGYWKREEIEEKVENYIVAHSSFEAKEPEEEVDIDSEQK